MHIYIYIYKIFIELKYIGYNRRNIGIQIMKGNTKLAEKINCVCAELFSRTDASNWED